MTEKVETSLLVASHAVADADLVKNSLTTEFGTVHVSTDPKQAVADFDRHRPTVLILAFGALDAAQQYYLGLYRHSNVIHDLLHRTIVLCNKGDVTAIYDLCRRDYFDDYVLYWPVTFDYPRLAMSVHLALRALANSRAESPSVRKLAAAAKKMVDVEPVLDEVVARGNEKLQAADRSLRKLTEGLGSAVSGFSSDLSERLAALNPGSATLEEVRRQLRSLKEEQIDPRLREAAEILVPTRECLSELPAAYRAPLQSIREFSSTLPSTNPSILIVEDEPMQRQVLAYILNPSGYALSYATTGQEAMRMAVKFPPDLILMDVILPDIDGVELTRRLKTSVRLSSVPVIVITGNSERAVVMQSLEAGAVDFLVKPITPDGVRRKIEQHLQSSRMVAA